MGGGKGGGQSMPPRLIPGTEGAFGAGTNLGMGFANAALPALGTGIGALTAGTKGGFSPQILASIEQMLLPALERSFGRGEAAIRESAANAGVLRSSGTVGQATDLREGLESGLLSQLAGIQGQLGLADLGARLSAAQSLAGLPGQALGGLGSFLGNAPFYQPTQGPSGKEQFLSFAAPIAGSIFGGPIGGAIGSSITSGKGGGGGAQ